MVIIITVVVVVVVYCVIITKYLDPGIPVMWLILSFQDIFVFFDGPQGDRRITFEEFCNGLEQIMKL